MIRAIAAILSFSVAASPSIAQAVITDAIGQVETFVRINLLEEESKSARVGLNSSTQVDASLSGQPPGIGTVFTEVSASSFLSSRRLGTTIELNVNLQAAKNPPTSTGGVAVASCSFELQFCVQPGTIATIVTIANTAIAEVLIGDGWNRLSIASTPRTLEAGAYRVRFVESAPFNGPFDLITFSSVDLQDGTEQNNPILPTRDQVLPPGFDSETPGFAFLGGQSGRWFDPPLVDTYRFHMVTPNSGFTDILGLPTGLGNNFEVVVLYESGTERSLGSFQGGSAVNLDPSGSDPVEAFEVRGISPPVGPPIDPTDPLAFPIQLAFNSEVADFQMIPVVCWADWNADGLATSDDILDFLRDFENNLPGTRLANGENFTIFDILKYLRLADSRNNCQ